MENRQPEVEHIFNSLPKTDEWLDATARKARFNGAIRLIDLAFILAEDNSNIAIMPLLWEALDLSSEKAIAGLKNETEYSRITYKEVDGVIKISDISRITDKHRILACIKEYLELSDILSIVNSEKGRCCLWFIVLLRIAETKLSKHLLQGLPFIQKLSLYNDPGNTANQVNIEGRMPSTKAPDETSYITIDDFKSYMNDLGNAHNFKISFSNRLFPGKGKLKLRPDQLHKKQCREVAERIWLTHPDTTITAMIKHEEITKIIGERGYIDKTLRNWIKDLCPNREPGRPKKKT